MGLKSLRLKYFYSQEKLADLSKLSTRTIQRIEKEHKASLSTIKALAEVFNMPSEELKIIIESKDDEVQEKISEPNYKNFFDYFLKHNKTHIFLLINIVFFIVNILSSTYLWFIYPLCIWGFFHIRAVYKEYKNPKLS